MDASGEEGLLLELILGLSQYNQWHLLSHTMVQLTIKP